MLALVMVALLQGAAATAEGRGGFRPPETAAVAAQLRSGAPVDVAWAAHTAAGYRMTGAIPAVLEALGAARVDQSDLVAALLDTLIRLDASVPAELLLRHHERWPVQTLILLQRAGHGRESALLRVLQASVGDEWFAAANMLAQSRVPAFAEHLLATTTITFEVTVSDTGSEFTYADAPMMPTVSDYLVLHDTAYPPLALYRLHVGGGPGTVVLSAGPRAMHYTRTVHDGAVAFAARSERIGPYDEDRLEYLSALLRHPVELEIAYFFQAAARPADAATRAMAQCRAEAERRHALTVQALSRAGLLTGSAAARLAPRLAVVVHDRRSSRTSPLPDLQQVRADTNPAATCPAVP